MKSKLVKIWGVVLTLVVLIGLLVPAAAPVSAGNMQWTEMTTPNYSNGQLRPGSDVDFFVVAPDGKTMFSYSNAVAAVATAAAAIGAVTLSVDSTEGFPAASATLIIGGAAAVTYAAKTATSFTGIPAVGAGSIAVAHLVGETVTDVGAQGLLLKSTDGGVTWNGVNIGTGLNGILVSALAISPDYANDQTVVAAGAVTGFVYRSIDGGQTFGAMPAVAGLVGTIRSVAVSPWYRGGQAMLAGYANGAGGGGVSLFTTLDLTWVNLTAGTLLASWNNATVAPFTGGDVNAVAFSPNHRTDSQYLVVSTTAGGTFVKTRFAANLWDVDVAATPINPDAGVSVVAAASVRASIAFPKDYEWSSNNRFIVGVGRLAAIALAGGEDAYRVQGALAGGTSRAYDLNANGAGIANATRVSGIAFKGNIADGVLVVGQDNSTTVLSATNVTASTVTWISSTKNPTGGAVAPAVQVVASPISDAIFAATWGIGSALSVSMDKGVSFDGVSLIDVSAANRLSLTTGFGPVDDKTMFLLMRDDADNSATSNAGDYWMLFKTTDGGTSWTLVLALRETGALDFVRSFGTTRTYATDQTIYLWQADTRFWKSSNGGATWVGYTAQANITGFAVIDKDTYFTGHANAVYKSGRFTSATLDGETAMIMRMIDATTLSVSSNGAGAAGGDILISTDDGVTFTRLGPNDSMGAGNFAYTGVDAKYATNKTIYAGAGHPAAGTPASFGVYRWIMGQSTTWEQMFTIIDAAADLNNSGVDVAPDGTMYIGSRVAGVGIGREVVPTDVLSRLAPEAMTNARIMGQPAGATVQTFRRLTGAAGNTLLAVVGGVASGSFGYPFRLVTISDNMMNPLAITAPKAGAVVDPTVTLRWAAITSPVQVSYRYQLATDANFDGIVLIGGVAINNITDGRAIQIAGLTPGNSYFWRVRVEPFAAGPPQTGPLASRWSPATQFTVKLGQTVNQLQIQTPDPQTRGSQPIRPIFSWNSVSGAESYELELADNPFFANSQAKKPLMNTVWAWDKDLEYSTTYYFRVRAISGKNVSDWVQSVFTTIAKPAPPAPTVAPAPTIPTITIAPPAPVKKFFDPQSGQYFDNEADLRAYQQTHPPALPPATPGYIWAVIIIAAVLVIAVIVLIVRTRRVA